MNIQKQIYFNYCNRNSPVTVRSELVVGPECQFCHQSKWHVQFDNVRLLVNDMTEWPLFMSGFKHSFLHEKVVHAIQNAGITGCRFHPLLDLGGNWLRDLPDPPKYYVWEPIGSIGIKISMDEGSLCSYCGVFEWKVFGAASKPLVFDWSEWDGTDVVTISRLPSMILVNRRVVELFRSHGWHHQIKLGRCNKKWDAMEFGNYKVPGLGIRNIDSDTWYDDTLAALRAKYPEREWP